MPLNLGLEDAFRQIAADLRNGSRTSFTARSIGVPSVNETLVFDEPSVIWLVMLSTPLTERSDASSFWVTCDSSSGGAAPGWPTDDWTTGMLMSGWTVHLHPQNATRPASVSAMNSTIGATGLRIAQDDMLRKLTRLSLTLVCYFSSTVIVN